MSEWVGGWVGGWGLEEWPLQVFVGNYVTREGGHGA